MSSSVKEVLLQDVWMVKVRLRKVRPPRFLFLVVSAGDRRLLSEAEGTGEGAGRWGPVSGM